MDITKKCEVSGKGGFDLPNSNRCLIVEVEGKNGDRIKVNELGGIRFREIWTACECPAHEDRPAVNDRSKIVFLGGEDRRSRRTVCVVGR